MWRLVTYANYFCEFALPREHVSDASAVLRDRPSTYMWHFDAAVSRTLTGYVYVSSTRHSLSFHLPHVCRETYAVVTSKLAKIIFYKKSFKKTRQNFLGRCIWMWSMYVPGDLETGWNKIILHQDIFQENSTELSLGAASGNRLFMYLQTGDRVYVVCMSSRCHPLGHNTHTSSQCVLRVSPCIFCYYPSHRPLTCRRRRGHRLIRVNQP